MAKLEKGVSVTQFVGGYSQPNDGFLKPYRSKIKHHKDNETLFRYHFENIKARTVGTIVDSITRSIVDCRMSMYSIEYKLKKLDNDETIKNCCDDKNLDIAPNSNTINNIRIMVKRTVNFLLSEGTVITNFKFTDYRNDFIRKGNLDFIAGDTLWDLKVSVSPFTIKHTLQVLIYHIKYSWTLGGSYLKHVGLYNPRLSISYKYDMTTIDPGVYAQIQSLVLYGNTIHTLTSAAEARIRGEKAGWLEKIVVKPKPQEKVNVPPLHVEPIVINPSILEPSGDRSNDWLKWDKNRKGRRIGATIGGLILLALFGLSKIVDKVGTQLSNQIPKKEIHHVVPKKQTNHITSDAYYGYHVDKINTLPFDRYTKHKKNGILTIDIYYKAHANSFNVKQAKRNLSGILKGTYECSHTTREEPKKVQYIFHFLKGGNRIYMTVPFDYVCK